MGSEAVQGRFRLQDMYLSRFRSEAVPQMRKSVLQQMSDRVALSVKNMSHLQVKVQARKSTQASHAHARRNRI